MRTHKYPSPAQSRLSVLARVPGRRSRFATRRARSRLVLAALLIGVAAVGPASATSSAARKSGKQVKVTFSTVPTLGVPGSPKCNESGCLIVIQPNDGTFTGDLTATTVGAQTISLKPAGGLPPTAVSVLVTVSGAVKGCAPGTIVLHSILSDFTVPGSGGRGTWTLLPKTGTGGFEGATGSGTVAEILNPDFSTKSIEHRGTISCLRA